MLLDLIDDKSCSGFGRDCCLDLIVKFVDRANGCDWTSKFIVSGNFEFFSRFFFELFFYSIKKIGLPKVLRVAATVPDLPDTEKKHYPLTEQTKMHISCVLSVVYHDLSSDKGREDFNNECIEFVK
jgi:hypothetical protein